MDRNRWTAESLSLLGKMSDVEVSRQLGLYVETIRLKRWELGIEAFVPPKVKPEYFSRLGSTSDESLAREFGVSAKTIWKHRKRYAIPAFQVHRPWTEAERALLGAIPDSEVAARLGRSRASVFSARRALGIVLTECSPHPHLEDIKRAFTDTRENVSDIARRYGVTPKSIYRRAGNRGWQRPAP